MSGYTAVRGKKTGVTSIMGRVGSGRVDLVWFGLVWFGSGQEGFTLSRVGSAPVTLLPDPTREI